ncbi:hypothetical protein FHS27_004541 [Rhodopirellula rubra]|uniref:Uncharacterized protein n=1 Tax=Aporhodopirellula rubra TaxID=980271 RepID=A0A7W5E1X4_9BACT|nr:hypothetical protein [Aporhodopirellula rubra]
MIREAAIRMRTRMPSVTSGPIPAAMLTSFERQRERIYQCRSMKLDSPDPRTTRSGEIGYVVFGNALAVLFPRIRRLPELSHRLVTVVTEAMETLIRQDSRTRQPVSCLNADLFRRRFW